jgi:hypothetical protein
MKYKILTVLILSFSVANLSFAEEKKNNYFGDDSPKFKKDKKNTLKQGNKKLNVRNIKKGKSRRVKLRTDNH